MKISVYAIAKNEEQIIRRWYDCFKEADEICVLVNNSTDNTAKILKELGAKVVEKTYDNFRFDVARNEAMKLCSPDSDLLFSSDIDDVIEAGWRKKIEYAWRLGVETGKNPNSILFTYLVDHNSKTGVKQKMVRHSIHTPTGWFWKCRIHEYLEHESRKEFIYYPKFEMTSEPVRQEHGAYLKLLEEECKDPNCEARSIHLLAREYLTNKKYQDALTWFDIYLKHIGATWNCERAASMKFIADCYLALGKPIEQELWLWRAMEEDTKNRDAPYVLGIILARKKEWRAAAAIMERCVAIKSPDLDYPYFNLASWTEHPWLVLAEARYYLGEWTKALQAINKALEVKPDSELGLKMKDDIKKVIASGAKPHLPPPEVPRERIEIPELIF